ncbi:hypothetical protein LP421_13850 [Rhizobium sp. RCAM05350]|nr:hypothetical protein LP421_13850 [Rhizobium sp. RCAM05350]
MGSTFDLSDWAIIFATLMGPVLAVQAQKWVEASRERKTRRVTIFRVLMATRAASLSTAHVEALNAIPIEFYGWRPAFKDVVLAWRNLLDHLSNDAMEMSLWNQKRQDFFIELLWRLATALGYRFTKLELQREVYSPRGHATLEAEQDVIRKGMFRIFNGEAAFPLDIKSIASDQATLEQQQRLHVLLEQWLTGNLTVKVDMERGGDEPASKG